MSEVKEASHKRACIVGFQLYEPPRTGQSLETRRALVVVQRWA